MGLDYAERHIVVTGGTGALGTAVVSQLLEAGACCHVSFLDPEERERFALGGHTNVQMAEGVDLSDDASVQRFFQQVAAVPLWASIHLAGGFAMQPIEATSGEDFLKQLKMNAMTCFLCCREAAGHMKQGGRIVNVAARPALEPRTGAGMSAYTASKAAVAALTQALAGELVDRGILVNAVAPSIMDTPANRKAMPGADHDKWPTTDEVARTILFLASPQNACTRGAVVPVYGRA